MHARHLFTVIVLVLAIVTTTAAQQAAQPRDPRAAGIAPAGTGVVRGRVIAAESGVPVRQAIVQLMSGPIEKMLAPSSVATSPGSTRRVVASDDDGRFEIVGLSAGSYTMLVMPGPHRSAFLSTSTLGEISPITTSVDKTGTIELGDGETRTVEVVLSRAGAINGRVVDSLGEPLSRIQVSAMLLHHGNEGMVVGTATSDDRGMFRLFGLREGQYIVAVDARITAGSMQPEGARTAFLRTFAPGTPRRDEATRIRLTPGGEASVEIRLVETALFDVGGLVVNQSGQPLGGANVSLLTGEGQSAGSVSASDGAGRFVIRDVAPGDYQLAVNYTPPAPPDIASGGKLLPPEFVLTRIQVNGPVDDLVLVTAKGETFTGAIRFDGATAAERTVKITVHAPERRPFTLTPRLEVKGETFTAEGVFAPLLIRGTAVDQAPEPGAGPWHLKAVTLDGHDITDIPTVFKAAHTGRVQVIFTRRAATLEVQVTEDDGSPPRAGSLLVFGEEDTWLLSSSRTRVVSLVGRNGRVAVPGLRSGRYYVAAVPGPVVVSSTGPSRELLVALKGDATPVVLDEGEVRAIEVRMMRLNR